MPNLKTVADGFVCQREFDNATIGRIKFWTDHLGERELAEITPDDVDAVLVLLAERGRLRAGRGLATERTGKPLAGCTLNRYIGQLASLYKYARRLRLLPRAHLPPTRGIEKAPEKTRHERYFRPEEVERLVKVGRLLDRRWGRFEALVVLAYHTGLRKSNLLNLRWRDVDLAGRTLSVQQTKNGDPLIAPLSPRAAGLLAKLPHKDADALVFDNGRGRPFDCRRLWLRACAEAGIKDKTFHALRHGCGHALASAGVNQAQIMQIMGHRSFAASARYMHANAEDKRRVIEAVFA